VLAQDSRWTLPYHSFGAIKVIFNLNDGIPLTTKLFCIGQARVGNHARSLRLTVTNVC
jgi:hypothetical protein